MKIAGRILYALVMVIFFLFTFDYAQRFMEAKYFEDNGIPILEKEDVDYTFFYGSVPNYYATEAQYSANVSSYALNIFEIAQTVQIAQGYTFTPYYYITIHSKTHAMKDNYELVITTSLVDTDTQENIKKIIEITQFRQLNLFVAVNDKANIYIDPTFFVEHEIIEITLKQGDEILFTHTPSPHIFTTSIDQKLTTFYENEKRLPIDDDLKTQGVFPYHRHIMDDYMHVFVIAMIVYFSLLGIATYFTFFFKPARKVKKTDVIQKIDG